jgi:hypothetical protein
MVELLLNSRIKNGVKLKVPAVVFVRKSGMKLMGVNFLSECGI